MSDAIIFKKRVRKEIVIMKPLKQPENLKMQVIEKTYVDGTCKKVQSNLVISNSLISNYRLSRSENLVPVLT